MLFIYATFIIAVSLVYGQKPCCVQTQWEGQLSMSTGIQVSGMAIASFAYYNFSYNYDSKLIALRGVTINTDNVKTNVRLIQNYNENIDYYINLDNNTCLKQMTSIKLMQCIPGTTVLCFEEKEMLTHLRRQRMPYVFQYIHLSH
ncbi:unnamed protein product [Didymodactylos carnosus]|uniref:Uncharacterized protein n=1 Tax=Didymodactylos carnosus TaxID=1234261 RepID=A0A816B0Y0_9BILA|nr:unnamed protein product [Didymodactylos carnosus]CAF4479293.1 unnamed protein product [Didymodactylos carnosus]